MTIFSTKIQEFYKALSLEPDDEDLKLHEENCSPLLLTKRLHELVPLLSYTNAKVERVSEQETILSIPLGGGAINQNGTHQASVFYLIADNTAGVGIFGALPGCYVTGIHDRCPAQPIQLWLKKGIVEHLSPGTSTLKARVAIPEEDRRVLRENLMAKGHTSLTVEVKISENDLLVARTFHTMGVYFDNPRLPGKRANFLQAENNRLSAIMIAGLRNDKISKNIAGDQGVAIANRMSVATPELPSLVKSREAHLEQLICSPAHSFSQVVSLGVGFDIKPIKYSSEKQIWYGLDLNQQLKERKKIFKRENLSSSYFLPIPTDFRLPDWSTHLLKSKYDPEIPTLFILEGISMYLTVSEIIELFSQLRKLTNNSQSRGWFDHVTNELYSIDNQSIKAFLNGMIRLGEPFLTGFSKLEDIIEDKFWQTVESKSASDVLEGGNIVQDNYIYSIFKPG